jgi:hypothetical protein
MTGQVNKVRVGMTKYVNELKVRMLSKFGVGIEEKGTSNNKAKTNTGVLRSAQNAKRFFLPLQHL